MTADRGTAESLRFWRRDWFRRCMQFEKSLQIAGVLAKRAPVELDISVDQ